jgi:predicted small secreted protein
MQLTKKLISGTLVLAVSLALTGCNGKQDFQTAGAPGSLSKGPPADTAAGKFLQGQAQSGAPGGPHKPGGPQTPGGETVPGPAPH